MSLPELRLLRQYLGRASETQGRSTQSKRKLKGDHIAFKIVIAFGPRIPNAAIVHITPKIHSDRLTVSGQPG